LQAGAVLNFPIPVPAAVDLSGEFEMMRAGYLSFSHHRRYRRWIWGYGISYGVYVWEWVYFDRFDPPPPTRPTGIIRGNMLGLVASVYYEAGRHFGMGLVYRPGLLQSVSRRSLGYQHVITLDFAWKIPLIR
jgi:hypothetical protein